MKIPKSFEMINRKIEVVITDKNEYLDHGHNLGYTRSDYEKNEYKIYLSKSNIDNIETFIHEFLHQLFDVVRENELKENEKLIDLMSQVITQAINTAKR